MLEPGVTLTRLVVAERNALAAMQTAEDVRKAAADGRQRIAQLEGELAMAKQSLDQLRMLVISRIGTGPTS